MTPWRVISTLPDGRVHVLGPSARLVEVLKEGGGLALETHCPESGVYRYGLRRWLKERSDLPAELRARIKRSGLLPIWLARAWEMEKHLRDPSPRKIRDGRAEFIAKWLDAKIYGGYEEPEAILLIWEYTRREGAFHPDAKLPEIVHESDLAWAYRPAWRRSHNGGPIWLDEDKALALDEARAWTRYEMRA